MSTAQERVQETQHILHDSMVGWAPHINNSTVNTTQETKQDVTLETLSAPKEFVPTYIDDPEQLKLKAFSYTAFANK